MSNHKKPSIDQVQEDVLRFMYAMGMTDRSKSIGEFHSVELCKSLIKEEYEELIEGLDERSMEKTIDGMADLIYVIYFTANKMGIPMWPFHHEVQKSNMSKVGGPKDPETGKQLKPEGWEEPCIQGLLTFLRHEGYEPPEIGDGPRAECGTERCVGWNHFFAKKEEGTVREIKKCDMCDLFDGDDAAIRAHDTVCGCGWESETVLCSECGNTLIHNNEDLTIKPIAEEFMGRLYCAACKPE